MSKGLEALERIIESFYDKESEDIKCVKKELKALEIIKTKKVATFLLIWLMNKHTKKTALELYNRSCDEDRQLTEEEYDLLKEELLWKN